MDFFSFVGSRRFAERFNFRVGKAFFVKESFIESYLAIIRSSNKNNNNKIKTQRTAGFVQAWQNISRKIIWEGNVGQHISLSSL